MTSTSKLQTQENEWIQMVLNEQRKLSITLVNNPIQCLMQIFELFDAYLDTTTLREINLYTSLNQLYENNSKTPLINSIEENFSLLSEMIFCLKKNREKIKDCNPYLYYALLNFQDYLKVEGIYAMIMAKAI